MIAGHQWMDTNEMTHLVELLQMTQPRTMLEIGPHEGATSRVILDNVPSIEWYYGVQLSDPSNLHKFQETEMPEEPAKFVKYDPRFQLILRPNGSFDITAKEIGPVDVVFIDGDHSLFGVMHDTCLALRVAKKLIIWHDYNDLVEVKPVIDFLRDFISIVHFPTTWLAYHKV